MTQFDSNFWTQRYRDNTTGWDLGGPSLPLVTYIDQLKDKSIKILIPGAGNAYEAEYLLHKGFKNVFVLDISEEPLNNIKQRVSNFPASQLVHANFFEHTGQYDLILEQTFFCALDPSLRSDYVKKMNQLLKPGGKLVGVVFTDPLNATTPPFGAKAEDYKLLFEALFVFRTFEPCINSIKPRLGRELFINFQKKVTV